MTSKFSIDNRELLQRISSGEAVVGIDFGNLIVRELAAFRLAAMDSEPAPVVPDGIERVATTLEYIGNFAGAAIIRQLAANQQQNAPQNIPEIIPDSCTWTFSNYDDHWSGTCGVEWIFPDGGPEENGVKFCPKCGKSVAVSATEGTEE